MCIFVKNAFLFVLYVVPLFSFSSIYLEIKLVISNHFGIVRLKTQSEKYMALKDEISRGVMWLRYMPQWLQTELFVHLLKRVGQVNTLSKAVGFSRVLRFPPTRKVDRVVWVIKK